MKSTAKINFFLCVLFATGLASSALSQWTELPKLPLPLEKSMKVEHNGIIYVFGGLHRSDSPYDATISDNIYTLNLTDSIWRKLSVKMPEGRWGGFATSFNDKIYLVGGAISNNGVSEEDTSTLEFSPTTYTFTKKSSMPIGVFLFSGVRIDNRIYVIGGTQGLSWDKAEKNVQVYDVQQDKWYLLTSSTLPDHIHSRATAMVDGDIYIIGGDDGFLNYSSTCLKGVVSDSKMNIFWEEIANLPIGCAQGSAGVLNGALYITGGLSSPFEISNQSYTYDHHLNKWTESYEPPVISFGSGDLVDDDTSLYYIGGSNNNRVFKISKNITQSPHGIIHLSDKMITISKNDSQSFKYKVENTGEVPLIVETKIADQGTEWISMSASQNIVEPHTSKDIFLQLKSGHLAAGLYTTIVHVKTNDVLNDSQSFRVRMYVLEDSVELQRTKVILETATGIECGSCPPSHKVREQIKNTHMDKIISLAYHGSLSPERYQTIVGSKIFTNMGIVGYPAGAVQRYFFPDRYFPNKLVQLPGYPSWPSNVNEVLESKPTSPVSIKVLSYSYDTNSNKIDAKLLIRRTHAVILDTSVKIHLTTIVKENGIIDIQQDYENGDHAEYHHDDIVRQVIPDEHGIMVDFGTEPLLAGNIVNPDDDQMIKIIKPGNYALVEVSFNLDLEKVVNPSNCDIVFIVNTVKEGGMFGDILQGAEIQLSGKPLSANFQTKANTMSVSTFPNPANDNVIIAYDLVDRSSVSLVVIDPLGREVSRVSLGVQDVGVNKIMFDVSQYSPGIYSYKLLASNNEVSGSFIVVK